MKLFSHLIFLYLFIVMPLVGRSKYAKLKEQLATGHNDARLHFYRMTMLQQALLSLAVLTLCLSGFASRRALGLAAPLDWQATMSTVAILIFAIIISIFLFRSFGTKQLRRLMKMAGALVPMSSTERRYFAVLAVGAGVSEELAFRGFLIFYFTVVASHLDLMIAAVVASIVFGFCHVYQGWLGVILTAILGMTFAFFYLTSFSLLTPIVIHAAIDLRLLFILTPARVESLQRAAG